MSNNYVYLIQEREFVRLDEPIYKIGKTTMDNLQRIIQYPTGSRLILQTICSNCHTCEKEIIDFFKNKYKIRKDYGNEYFEGNHKEMMKDIYNIIIKDIGKCEIPPSNLNMENFVYDNSNEIWIKVVRTHEDCIKYTGFDKIIITDKKNCKGFIRFEKNSHWYEFSNDSEEDLKYWFENNTNDIYINPKTFQKLTSQEFYFNKQIEKTGFKCLNIEFDYDKLFEDLNKKCFETKPNFYDFKYNEFGVYIEKDNRSQFKIFDTKNLMHKEIPIDEIALGRGSNIMQDIKNLRIDIIDELFKNSIDDTKILTNFKKICYNIFIKPNDNVFIFNISPFYFEPNSHSYCLTEFLYTMKYKFNISKYDIIDADDYYSNIKEYNKNFKTKIPRAVIIDEKSSIPIKKSIEDFKKLHIKNIIIINKNRVKFNYYNLEKYIKENMEKINEFLTLYGMIDNKIKDVKDVIHLIYNTIV
jgi:hypothetical protein